MTALRAPLAIGLAILFLYTGVTLTSFGLDFLIPFFGEMTTFSWQGQFNLDFMMFLLLSGYWTAWRSGFTKGAILLGLAACLFGMSFLAAYLLYLIHKTKGDTRQVMLGLRAS